MLIAANGAQATTYRWVDANGVVHYSDRPQPGAAKVDLPSAQTYTRPAAPAAPTAPAAVPAPAAAPAPIPLAKTTCAITEPANEQTIINASAVTVRASGPVGGIAKLMLDGGAKQTSPVAEFLVTPIARGSHSAVVIFSSAGGGVLCRTEPVTFFVRQPTILRKAPPKR